MIIKSKLRIAEASDRHTQLKITPPRSYVAGSKIVSQFFFIVNHVSQSAKLLLVKLPVITDVDE